MPAVGSTSPSWSNEDADDFWDDDLGALDDVQASLAGPKNGELNGMETSLIDGKKDSNASNNGHVATKSGEDTNITKHQASNGLEKAELREITNALDLIDTILAEDSEILQEPELDTELVQNETQDTSEKDVEDIQSSLKLTTVAEDVLEPAIEDLHLDGESVENLNGNSANLMKFTDEAHHEPPEKAASTTNDDSTSNNGHINEESCPDNGHSSELMKNDENGHESIGKDTKSADIAPSNNYKETEVDDSPPEGAESISNPEISGERDLHDQIKALKKALAEKDAALQQHQASKEVSSGTESLARIQELEETLEKTELERDHAQEQLEGFLNKISSMKTVFQNFKATQKELDEVKQELAEAKEERDKFGLEKDQINARLKELDKEHEKFTQEKTTQDSQNQKYLDVIESLKTEALDLNRECDRLSLLMGTMRREFLAKEESLQDEKYSLEHEVGRLNKKISSQNSAYNELELEKEEATIENKNLTAALEEVRDRLDDRERAVEKAEAAARDTAHTLEARIAELETLIKGKDDEIEKLQAENKSLDSEVLHTKEVLETRVREIEQLEKEKEKIKLLEEDVHSKQLIIGKLRHEAIILNEHLTKSLSMLKQKLGDSDHTVDRTLVSNLILNFLQIPRGDTKKFEALALIAGLLDWDDEKKIQAGLMHSSGKHEEGKPQRLGLISLWTDFLDKESSKK
ncbi:hypothetical protein HF325_006789 [Metschnikowia pulcherrima]|uniref:GRIP domain-containing protein n=1 Tax=Metschnikowia pulcherrima TaxID=27326 RepID=A0A8H7L878_9ASCO|nr:hypothetical protein HF325_006789 [Metschnikowia pulcherrima]